MRKTSDIFMLLLAVCLMAVSCTKEKLATIYNSQESQIDSYISKNSGTAEEPRRVVYNQGSSRLVLTEGEGEELAADGNISFYYAGYTFSGSVSASNLFTTNREETAAESNWTITDPDYSLLTINLKEFDLVTGLKNGLTGVRTGETCEILFSGKYGFGKRQFGVVPANSALIYRIWVVNVSND